MKQGEVIYGDSVIRFQILERPNRRTLGIEVHPDGSVRVLGPPACPSGLIEEKVRQRARWITRHIQQFSRYGEAGAPRRYVSGESHRYLGRQYRLRVFAGDQHADRERITLSRNTVLITSPRPLPPERVKILLKRWYRGRAHVVFEMVLEKVFGTFERLGFPRPRLVVREMRSRWGSLSPCGQMTLNLRLIQAPRPCIEYVITHELCHLISRDHGPTFYERLTRILPDWKSRKERLESTVQDR